MVSIRARLGRHVVWGMFNMNPDGGKSFAEVTEMVSDFRETVPKGYERSVETSKSGIKFERIKKIGEDNGKLVLYIHGGGYTAGLSKAYRDQACDYSKAAGGAQVFLLDYTLAPEALYPVQHNQAYAFWKDVLDMGYKPKDIIVGGDSAGANLTLSIMLRLRDEGAELPKALYLISPWADMTASGKSYELNYHVDPMFGKKKAELSYEMRDRLLKSDMYSWCGDADRTDPLVSPVFGDYKGFPPTLMTVGADEILLDDTRTIEKKMKAEGIDVRVISHEKMFHIYPLYYTMFPESKKAYKMIQAYISEMMK